MKKDSRDTIVIIDSEYLYKIAKHYGHGNKLKCHINTFAIRLCKERGLWCNEIYYYTAPPYQSPIPTSEENLRKKGYDNFLKILKSLIPSVTIREGRCQKDENGKFHQKGVDTHLIMDLQTMAQRREVPQVIVVACDTDFVPVFNKVRTEYGLKIILAYFFDGVRKGNFSMSNHMFTACDDKIFIKKEYFDTTPVINDYKGIN